MGDKRKILLCDCEESMPLDRGALEEVLGGRLAAPVCTDLCRRQSDVFIKVLAEEEAFHVGCTQQAGLFEVIKNEVRPEGLVDYFNIREFAGWSDEAAAALPKIMALIAGADAAPSASRCLEIESDGLCVIYGVGQAALDAAKLLAPHVPVSVVLKEVEDALPLFAPGIAVSSGRVKRLSGAFAGFQLSLEDYAPLRVSSRDELLFEPARPHQATASVVLDLCTQPLVRGKIKPEGYFHCSGGPAQLSEILLEIIDLKGTFEKPLYVSYREDRCAHSANDITGCTLCLDHCPLSAVGEAGAKVVFDPKVCEGCGACAALCPTGAVTYEYPVLEDRLKQMAAMVSAYREAGGVRPELLIYARQTGWPVVEAAARFGRGLPARTIPLDVHQVLGIDHVLLLAALMMGYGRVTVLASEVIKSELASLKQEIELASAFVKGLFGAGVSLFDMLIADDPQALESVLWERAPAEPLLETATVYEGEKRQIFSLVMSALGKAADFTEGSIPLPLGAPYGAVEVDRQACTLCLACVSACPVNALGDRPDRPELNFKEVSCVQCGLCRKTCPEEAITLKPRYLFGAEALSERVLNEEEPFHCVRCGTAFGVKSTIEKITEKLAETHWMFQSSDQIELIKMCDQCRVVAMAEAALHGDDRRPLPRTSDDYGKDGGKA